MHDVRLNVLELMIITMRNVFPGLTCMSGQVMTLADHLIQLPAATSFKSTCAHR